MKNTIKIRPMSIEDYENVYTLWLAVPGMGLNNLDDSEEGIARYLARNPKTCFVAEKDGEIAGAILCGHDGRRGQICHTCVHPALQRQGIGEQLVDRALMALKEERIHKVNLVAFAANKTGNAFWQKLGFTTREDLVYRNRLLSEMVRNDT